MLVATQARLVSVTHQVVNGIDVRWRTSACGYSYGYSHKRSPLSPRGTAEKAEGRVLAYDKLADMTTGDATLISHIALLERVMRLKITELNVTTKHDPRGRILADGQPYVLVPNFVEVVETLLGLELLKKQGLQRARLIAVARPTDSSRTLVLLGESAVVGRRLSLIAQSYGMPAGMIDKLYRQWMFAMRRLLGVNGCTNFAIEINVLHPSAHEQLRYRQNLKTADWTSFERMLETGRAAAQPRN